MDLTALREVLNPREVNYLEQALLTPIKSISGDLDIELTEDEVASALLDAKIKKRTKLKYEENERLRHVKVNQIMHPFNTEQLIDFCYEFFGERFQKRFIVDDDNRRIVYELAKYFTQDVEFNKGSFSLNKGILLMGNVGSGKTSIMSFFQKNKKQCYTIKSCNDVAEDYLIYKDEIEIIYSTPIEKPLQDPSVFFQKFIGYCFDDLGTEENKNSFGNKKNVMADIILALYPKKEYTKFHITTNLDEKEIEARYGSRILSRIGEMFNVFILNGKDRRL